MERRKTMKTGFWGEMGSCFQIADLRSSTRIFSPKETGKDPPAHPYGRVSTIALLFWPCHNFNLALPAL